MDYQSEEFQRNKISHKKRFFNVLNELIHSRKNKHVYEAMRVKHEYAEFLQHVDLRRDQQVGKLSEHARLLCNLAATKCSCIACSVRD